MQDWLVAKQPSLAEQRESVWKEALQPCSTGPKLRPAGLAAAKLNSGLHALDSQQKLLSAMVDGITGMSREILSSIRQLKLKKSNINDLLNQLTAMTQAKASLGQLGDYAKGKSTLEQLKKFVIGLQSSLDNVPARYFAADREAYQQFTTELEGWLKERLDESLLARNLADVNSITSLMGLLKVQCNVAQKYEDLISLDLQTQIDEAVKWLDDRCESLVSMQRCLSSEDYELTSRRDSENSAPRIFLDTLVDVLSITMEQITNLQSNSGVIDSPDSLRQFVSVLLEDKLDSFLQKVRVRMDKFYGIDMQSYASKKDEVSITIERDPRNLPKFSKTIDEIVIIEHYLNEVTLMLGQIRVYVVDVGKEVGSLIRKLDPEAKRFASSAWGPTEVHRMLMSLSFNTSLVELASSCQGAQEKALKGRMAVVLSQSSSLRTLFFGDAATLTKAAGAERTSEEGPTNPAAESTKLTDYLEDVLFCVRATIFRAIGSLDKIAACTCITYATQSILCSDLYRLTKQLMQKYLNLAAEGAPGTVGLFATYESQNHGAAAILNSMSLVIDLTAKLAKQVQDFTRQQLEGIAEKSEIQLIVDTTESLQSQVSKAFRDLLRQSLQSLAEAATSKDIASTLSLYHAFEFTASDKEFSEYESLPTKWSVALKLTKKLTGVFGPWRASLAAEVYEQFVKEVGVAVHAQLFAAVQKKKKFNQLGAIILDREVQTIVKAMEGESEVGVAKVFAKTRGVSEVLLSHSKEEAAALAAKHGLSAEETNKVLGKCADFGLKV